MHVTCIINLIPPVIVAYIVPLCYLLSPIGMAGSEQVLIEESFVSSRHGCVRTTPLSYLYDIIECRVRYICVPSDVHVSFRETLLLNLETTSSKIANCPSHSRGHAGEGGTEQSKSISADDDQNRSPGVNVRHGDDGTPDKTSVKQNCSPIGAGLGSKRNGTSENSWYDGFAAWFPVQGHCLPLIFLPFLLLALLLAFILLLIIRLSIFRRRGVSHRRLWERYESLKKFRDNMKEIYHSRKSERGGRGSLRRRMLGIVRKAVKRRLTPLQSEIQKLQQENLRLKQEVKRLRGELEKIMTHDPIYTGFSSESSNVGVNPNEVTTSTDGAGYETPQEQPKVPVQKVPDVLQMPYPELELINRQTNAEAPWMEQLDEYLESEEAQELLRAASEDKFEIAREFISWAKDQPEHPGILLNAQEEAEYWFVGDLHGGTRALVKILCYIRKHLREGMRQYLIFLGDFPDRGEDSWGTLALVQQLVLETRGNDNRNVVLICGNHDEGVRRDGDKYTSNVLPAESVEVLNAMDSEQAALLFNSLEQLVRISSRMGEIGGLRGPETPETLLFCHGGVPHVDLQEELRKRLLDDVLPSGGNGEGHPLYGFPLLDKIPPDLREQVMHDCVWLRFAEKIRHKIPNRLSSGCDIGYEDVDNYRLLHYRLTGRAIASLVRGHDHKPKGYGIANRHEIYNPTGKFSSYNALTINAMEATDEYLFRARDISLLHWQMGENLKLIVLPSHHPDS